MSKVMTIAEKNAFVVKDRTKHGKQSVKMTSWFSRENPHHEVMYCKRPKCGGKFDIVYQEPYALECTLTIKKVHDPECVAAKPSRVFRMR
jgi:hypothetical protein